MTNKVDDYIARLDGWQAEVASSLRRHILAVAGISENFKWGQPIYESDQGPVCLIKSYKSHVGLGFWRGQQMAELDARLVPVGSFRMADIKLRGPGEIGGGDVRRLVESGIRLNVQYGNPLAELKK